MNLLYFTRFNPRVWKLATLVLKFQGMPSCDQVPATPIDVKNSELIWRFPGEIPPNGR